MAKFKHNGTLKIRDFIFEWHTRHWGGASTAYENQRGISVLVCIEYGKHRELIIEFPFTDYFFDKPKSQTEFEQRIRSNIEKAIESGWKPESRGKAFHMNAENKR